MSQVPANQTFQNENGYLKVKVLRRAVHLRKSYCSALVRFTVFNFLVLKEKEK